MIYRVSTLIQTFSTVKWIDIGQAGRPNIYVPVISKAEVSEFVCLSLPWPRLNGNFANKMEQSK